VHRDGSFQLVVPENALITPLAREEADRHGIELVERGKTPNPPAAGRHIPTCNPSDVERVSNESVVWYPKRTRRKYVRSRSES
jgi:hypothetical protein